MEKTAQANKLIKKQRVTRYFIDAARAIAKEEGVSAITIRSVAERAGYNSATLYNYFENLDQLIAFVCIDSISDMIENSNEVYLSEDDYLNKYLRGWKDFCNFSFRDPAIYEYIYASEKSEQVLGSYDAYLEIFPEKRNKLDEIVVETYLKNTFYAQEIFSAELCVKEGIFRQEDVESIAMLGVLLYQSLLQRFRLPNNKMTEEDATKTFMHYLVSYIQPRLLKEKDLSQYL